MALSMIARWQMIRELSYFKKSGTLTVQIGRSYLSWAVNEGNLLCFSSNSAEHSFTRFLYESGRLEPERITAAQSMIGETRSLGAAMIQKRIAEPDSIRRLLQQHCFQHIHLLFTPAAHVLITYQIQNPKQHMLNLDLSFSELLMHCDRSSLDIRSVVEFTEQISNRYKIYELESIETKLQKQERRMLPYLKTGASLQEILADPELDRLTCYRVLFLLWIAGYLQEIQQRVREETTKETLWLMNGIRAIPPEWIFPLVLGILLGVILAPERDPPNPTPQPPVQSLPLVEPAWRD